MDGGWWEPGFSPSKVEVTDDGGVGGNSNKPCGTGLG